MTSFYLLCILRCFGKKYNENTAEWICVQSCTIIYLTQVWRILNINRSNPSWHSPNCKLMKWWIIIILCINITGEHHTNNYNIVDENFSTQPLLGVILAAYAISNAAKAGDFAVTAAAVSEGIYLMIDLVRV